MANTWQIQYIIMIIVGVILVVGGYGTSERADKPYDILGALGALAGLILTFLGILLGAVPNFFQS